MDPYLEQFWRDIHARLVIYACDQLQGRLPGDLRARVEERVFVESVEGIERHMFPDVRVVERGRGQPGPATGPTGLAVAEPVVVHAEEEEIAETYVEIVDVGTGKRVVTVIEFLSLSNKLPGEGWEQYRRKQRELRAGRVGLVEVDLLRTGRRVFSIAQRHIPESHRTMYQVCVRWGWEVATHRIYRAPLRERLPIIEVPLRSTDPLVPLDLQELVDQCYRNGGYDNDIDYGRDADPPLDPDDARWADELLRDAGRR